MHRRPAIADVRARTYKARDAWWTVLLVDPLAVRLVRWVAPYRWVTPNRLTLVALGVGLCAAAAFARGGPAGLLAGALLFHLSFVVDCMDGKVARLNGTGSVFGIWIDFVVDQVRVVVCALALMVGQFARTGELVYLYAAMGVLIVDILRYMSAWHMGKVRRALRRRRAAHLTGSAATGPGGGGPAVAAEEEPRHPGGPRARAVAWLHRRRIREHLFSGVEFQMATFVVGPALAAHSPAALLAVPAAAAALTLVFEAALAWRLAQHAAAVERRYPEPAAAAVPRQRSAAPGLVSSA